MSASISCSEALAAIRRGETLPGGLVRQLGEEQPADFFRVLVEALADSFDPAEAAAYENLMRTWIPPAPQAEPRVPDRVDAVYVLSRVTLGADIKIVSPILDAMKRRFPDATTYFVSNRKSAELFGSDPGITHLQADYPRSGPVSLRIEFADELRRRLRASNSIVVDPDSRMTQLGLIPVCEPAHYFHFPSRTTDTAANLTDLVQHWLVETFEEAGQAYIAPVPVGVGPNKRRAALSLGVGGNECKRLAGDFEARIIRTLAGKFEEVLIDRGAGGEEAARVTSAVEESGCKDRVRFCEGSFAAFASVIEQSELYVGYDSAGQHAAAAAGTPLISIFAGAASDRFTERWAPRGPGEIHLIDADSLTPSASLERFLEIAAQCSGV